MDDQEFEYRNHDVYTQHNGLATRVPQVASISPNLEMLALGYRGGAVCLWDIREKEFIGWARDEDGRLAAQLLFNPNPNTSLLLVIYTNHGLALYDTWSGDSILTREIPHEIGLLSASCSPDGRTLVTTDTRGDMYIWDFESLSILYHIYSPFPSFRILSFTSDGASVVDVMDSSMRIWSPAILVRKNAEEDSGTSGDTIQPSITEGEYESRKGTKITVVCAHPSLSVVFAGKYDGQVIAFSAKGDKSTTVLYSHSKTAFVTKIAVSKNSILASSDVTGVVQIRTFSPAAVTCGSSLAEIHTTAQVKQLCFSASGDYLLVATMKTDSVYRTRDGSCVRS